MSPVPRNGSDSQSAGGGGGGGGGGGHHVDLHVMYSSFRSQHETTSVGRKRKKIFFPHQQ